MIAVSTVVVVLAWIGFLDGLIVVCVVVTLLRGLLAPRPGAVRRERFEAHSHDIDDDLDQITAALTNATRR